MPIAVVTAGGNYIFPLYLNNISDLHLQAKLRISREECVRAWHQAVQSGEELGGDRGPDSRDQSLLAAQADGPAWLAEHRPESGPATIVRRINMTSKIASPV